MNDHIALGACEAAEILESLADYERQDGFGFGEDSILLEIAPDCLRRAIHRALALEMGARALREPREGYTTPLVFSAPGTAEAVRLGKKDVTRRAVGRLSSSRWREGCLARAYERSPRAGGQPFGEVRILGLRREPLEAITSVDVRREGFDLTVAQFVELFRGLHEGPVDDVWRIEFRLERLYDGGRK